MLIYRWTVQVVMVVVEVVMARAFWEESEIKLEGIRNQGVKIKSLEGCVERPKPHLYLKTECKRHVVKVI